MYATTASFRIVRTDLGDFAEITGSAVPVHHSHGGAMASLCRAAYGLTPVIGAPYATTTAPVTCDLCKAAAAGLTLPTS